MAEKSNEYHCHNRSEKQNGKKCGRPGTLTAVPAVVNRFTAWKFLGRYVDGSVPIIEMARMPIVN